MAGAARRHDAGGDAYSTHVLRQASARARRPTQTQPCKVIFLYYSGTIQEQALVLMGEKEAARQVLEGTFDTNALRALMNGGESDDIIAALARTLDTGNKGDARAAWKSAAVPVIVNISPTKRKTVAKAAAARSRAQGFLFDLKRSLHRS